MPDENGKLMKGDLLYLLSGERVLELRVTKLAALVCTASERFPSKRDYKVQRNPYSEGVYADRGKRTVSGNDRFYLSLAAAQQDAADERLKVGSTYRFLLWKWVKEEAPPEAIAAIGKLRNSTADSWLQQEAECSISG